MDYPWKVVGVEYTVSEKTLKEKVRLHCQRELQGEGCEGVEVGRIFFDPEYVKYDPHIGDVIIAIDGRFGVDRIVKIA